MKERLEKLVKRLTSENVKLRNQLKEGSLSQYKTRQTRFNVRQNEVMISVLEKVLD